MALGLGRLLCSRLTRSAGRPAGLNLTNDEELHSLLADIEAWKSNLPADLQFRGADTPRSAGTSALSEPIGARSASSVGMSRRMCVVASRPTHAAAAAHAEEPSRAPCRCWAATNAV